MGVAGFLLTLGLVAAAQAQNCSRPVGGENMNLQDNDIIKESFLNGTQATFTCNSGYKSSGGSPSITCKAGTWSTLIMTCTKKNCGPSEEVLNGLVEYPEGQLYGARLEVTCNPGYSPVGGSKDIFCRDSGWSGRLPSCQVTTCQAPPEIQNGGYKPKKEEVFSYRETATYYCNTDYTLNGTKSLTCSDQGVFTPEPPNCVMVECEEPVIDFAIWDGGSRGPHGYRTSVTYKCQEGFLMTGRGTLTCNIDSKWSPGLPSCESKAPKPTAPPPHDNSIKILGWTLGALSVVAVGAFVGFFFYRRSKQSDSSVHLTLLRVKPL